MTTTPLPPARLRLCLCAALLILSASAALGQQASSDLDEARRRNEEAQAEYYRAQTEKLNKPDGPKSFWRTLSDNAAILGALTAAAVALVSLFFNQRTTLRAQRDTQFYEALKRFGDKDSPLIRSSAAGLLAQMGTFEAYRRRLSLGGLLKRPVLRGKVGGDAGKEAGAIDEFKIEQAKRARARPYFNTAFDQLITGLMLEDNQVCLSSIVNAAGQLARSDPAWLQLEARARLLDVNLRLQEQTRLCVADFYATCQIPKAPDTPVKFISAALLTPYDADVLHDLCVADSAAYENRFKSSLRSFESLPDEKKVERAEAAQAALRSAAARLQACVEVCALTLKVYRPDAVNQVLDAYERAGLARSYERVFLPGVRLGPARMTEVNLSDAQLQGADLDGTDAEDALMYGVILRRASLREANLQKAMLGSADLRGASLSMAKLQGAQLDEALMEGATLNGARLEDASMSEANLQNASLWKAVLSGARLLGADLRGAKFRDTILDRVNLTGANLTGVMLQHVNLSRVVLKETRLAGAKLNQSVDLRQSNWWAADFFFYADGEESREGKGIDSGLLEELFRRHGSAVPADPEALHPSVREFLNGRAPQESAPGGAETTAASEV